MARWISALSVTVLLLAAGGAPAWAETAEERLERLMTAVAESMLWRGNYHQYWVNPTRWTQPIRLRSTLPLDDQDSAFAVATVKQLADLVGVPVEVLSSDGKDENFLLDFVETTAIYASDGMRSSCLATHWNRNGVINRIHLSINHNGTEIFQMKRCIRHEIMHGMGLFGHPHGLDSILSYVYHRDDFTEDDVHLLKALYSDKVKPNQYHMTAMLAAREVLAGRLGIEGELSHLARAPFQKAFARMVETAEGGDAAMQVQVGHALAFGRFVDKDPAAAVPWFRKAVAAGNSEGFVRLGWAYEKGEGVAADALAAWALYDLAAEKGNRHGEEGRQRIEKALSPDQRERARARRGEWQPGT